ncbi:hypothetical protein E27107_410005 [Elizabethkingia anophelis]|nr:hypothetical protein E18064_460054 [Elizabethkingia anophelis]CDN79131.1 hypothetical protein E27107_410005 [Elizabethkingia anophelis]
MIKAEQKSRKAVTLNTLKLKALCRAYSNSVNFNFVLNKNLCQLAIVFK